MSKEVNVLIVEDDYCARSWMQMLLRRDWRTRIVGEVNCPQELARVLQDLNSHSEKIDLVLIDTEIPHDDRWLNEVLRHLAKHNPKTMILFIGVTPDLQVVRLISQPNCGGYILKDEIRDSLAWAVSLATEKHLIITPGVAGLCEGSHLLTAGTLILNGQHPIARFSKRDAEAARMAFMISMERADLADEMRISVNYSYGLISALYKKMGLKDILQGNDEPVKDFVHHPAIKKHLSQAIEKLQKVKKENAASQNDENQDVACPKIKDQETLAFHLLTLPEIEEVGQPVHQDE